MGRNIIKIDGRPSDKHSSLLMIGYIFGGSLFLAAGYLLNTAGGMLLPMFVLTAALAVLISRIAENITGGGSISVYEGIQSAAGQRCAFLFRLFRLLAVSTGMLAETAGAGIVLYELLPSVPLWIHTLASAIIISGIQWIRSEKRMGRVHIFFVFLRVVTVLLFSVTIIGRRFLTAATGEKLFALGTLSIKGTACIGTLPVFVMLFGGIEKCYSFGIQNDTGKSRSVVFRIIILYFLAFAVLAISVPAYRGRDRTVAFLIAMELLDGKEMLVPAFLTVVFLASITCASSATYIISDEIGNIFGRKHWGVSFAPFLCVPLLFISTNSFLWLMRIAGILFSAVWVLLLQTGFYRAKQSRKKAKGVCCIFCCVVLLFGVIVSVFS